MFKHQRILAYLERHVPCTIGEVARKLSCSPSHVGHIAKRNNITLLRQPSKPRFRVKFRRNSQILPIAYAVFKNSAGNEGRTLPAIAEQFKCSREYVGRIEAEMRGLGWVK